MAVPVEANETEWFTPASLENVPDAPKFRLRAPDERNMRRYNMLVQDDNLRTYSEAAFHAEKETAIAELYDGETAQQYLARFRTIAESLKQNIEVDKEELRWVNELDEILFDSWPPLSRMRRKTNEYFEYSPRYAIGTIVRGWQNLDIPFRLEAGYMKTDDVRLIANKLIEIEQKAIADKVEGVALTGTAFLELWIAAMDRTRLTEDEEKNSPAPLPNSSSPEASTVAASGASTEENGKGESISTSSASNLTPKSEATDANSEAPKSE